MSRALTIIAEIAPGARPALDAALATIAADLHGNDVLRPGTLPATHFCRWVIVDDRRGELPALLVMESNHDGDARGYLAALAAAAPAGLDALFGCCVAYPAAGAADAAAFVAWARARSHRAAAFYRAYPGVTQAQVVNDAAVHDGIRAFLDAHRDELIGLAPVEVHARIRAHLRELARHRGLDITPQGDGEAAIALRKVGVYVAVAVALVLALALLPVTAPLFAWAYVTMRRKEQTDVPARYPHPVRDPDGLRADEDHVIQNQLTHVVDVKPGRFRLGLLRVVLFAIDVLARVWFVRGDLGGIVTIHFARWVVLPDRRPGIATPRHRLLFFSNYDGSWEAYLGEFIDRASGGLTAVWSNTDGFPRTTKLKEQGADDEETFKNWTRDHQIPTQVWWSGVPTATVQNVRNDVWIRRRLDRPMTEPELDQWLSQL